MAEVNVDQRASHAWVMNLGALGFFIAALLALAGFHFMAWWGNEPNSQGWHTWLELAEMVQARNFSDPIENTGLVMFPTSIALMLASPLLIGVLRRSRLVWWLLVLSSGACLIALGAFAFAISITEDADSHGPGFYCLLAALVLNLIGMFLVRRDIPTTPLSAELGEGPVQ